MINAKKFWDKKAESYAKSKIEDMASYEKKLAKTQEYFTAQSSVFEFGCGTGSTALIHAPYVKDILAIDISDNMIQIAKQKASEQSIENVTFEQGVLGDYAHHKDRYDCILGLNVLHLLEDFESSVQVAYSMTKPGGVFVTSTVMLDKMNRMMKILIPIMQVFGKAPYVNTISKQELLETMTQTGFEIDYEWQPNNACLFLIAKKPSRT